MSLKLNDEQRKLVEQNHNLIYSAMKDFGIHRKNFDDYYDVAAIGLCKAVICFDISKGTFSTFAYTYIYSELKKQIRDDNALFRKSNKNSVSYDEKISKQEDSNTYAKDILLVDENFEKNLILTLSFKDKLETISNIDKKIIMLTVCGYTQEEIGKILGVTKQAIQQRVHKMRQRDFKDLLYS